MESLLDYASDGSNTAASPEKTAEPAPEPVIPALPGEHANFEAAVQALTELPPGVEEFLLRRVVPMTKGDNICVQVSSASDAAHSHEFGASVVTAIQGAQYDSARLRRLGEWRFAVSAIGKTAPDKMFTGHDEVIDGLLLNFQLGYYMPPAAAAEGAADDGSKQDGSKEDAAVRDTSGDTHSADSEQSRNDSKNERQGDEEAAADEPLAEGDKGLLGFVKEGARVEQFIYTMCAAACLL
jgi:hypothetical protein